jgi:hypothetical protein|tara:strand:+ start:1571 stop:1900 length:330 start_codon:yes stop_codon:yes gene_type:complete
MFKNCFTETVSYLNKSYPLPMYFDKWRILDREVFVKHQNKFLARKLHIAFFNSFCEKVSSAKLDDVVLWKSGVGVCINKFFYWTYDHEMQAVVTRKIEKDFIIMRLKGE